MYNILDQRLQFLPGVGPEKANILQAELEEDINYTGTATKVADENGGYYQIRVSVLSEKLRFVEVDSEFGSYHQSFNGEIELMTAAAPKSRIIRFNWKLLGGV